MRNTDCYRLAKVLLPHLPGFVTNKRSELFLAPIGDVFRGFTFESTSGSREDFYFWWFFMPMAPATDHFHLSHGERLVVPRGNAGWRSDMDDLPGKLLTAMKVKALPLLRSINSNRDAVSAIIKLRYPEPITYIHNQNDIACLLLLDRQFAEARPWLEKVIEWERGPDRRQWILDIVERTKQLLSLLDEDPELAFKQVQKWRDFSFTALKLGNWR